MDFLAEKKEEIAARMEELRPLVAEYERLEKAASALSELSNGAAASTSTRRTTRSRTAGSSTAARSTAPATTGRRGRPPGSGKRSQQALELIQANPGITIPEIAEQMGIKQNYLYRVVPQLQKDGKVKKEGRGWVPA